MKLIFWGLVAAGVVSVSLLPGAARADEAHVASVLAASRAALHVDAVSKIRTLHLHGTANILGLTGTGDSWQNLRSGAFTQTAEAGPLSGGQGFDGARTWNLDASGLVWDDGGAPARYGSAQAAYFNRYALWSRDRGGAMVVDGGRKDDGGRSYDVLRVTPRGALPVDVWFDTTSHLPARSVAKIGVTTTTSTYADYRNVHGLMVPFEQKSDTDGNAFSFTAATATVDDPRDAAALARPPSRVSDFALASGETSIPFELVDNHVVLPVTINGKGPFQFIFDTGAQNVIDVGVAKQLGLGPAGAMNGSGVGATTEAFQFATVDTLGVGDATLRKQGFAVAPVRAGFGISSSKPVDGLIGWEVLSRFVTTFDYGTNTVVLRTRPAAVQGGTTVPITFTGQHVEIPCEIGGVGGECQIDTGSRISLTALSPFVAAHPAVVPANVAAVGANGFGVGGAAMGRLGRTTLRIAGYTIPDTITDFSAQKSGAFADPFTAGNIGAGALKRFAVTFDYPRQTMTLVPNAAFGTHETYDRSGTFLISQGGKVIVADVRPGTPAADAGLVRGEAITPAGASAATGIATLRELFRGAPGTAIPLTVTGKDGATRTVTLTLRDYV